MKVKELPIFTQCMNFHHSISNDDFSIKEKKRPQNTGKEDWM